MLYQNTGVESFLQEVFKPVQTIDEFILQLHKATSCVQEDVPVARIEGVLNCVDVSLSERAKEATIVLFDEGRAAGAPEVYEYPNAGGSTTRICIYGEKGQGWTPEQKEILKLMSQVIYNILSRLTLQELIKHVKGTDLVVGLPNLTAFMDFARELIVKGRIDEYESLYLNIRNFKYVNRKLSYRSGNEIMKQYEANLKDQLDI